MAVDLNELLARCVEIEKTAIVAAGFTTPDAVPYFIYKGEGFPYFTHRISNDDVGFESNEMDRDTYTVIIRLIIGHVTSNYVGINEDILYDYIPVIKTAFNNNEGLISVAYPDDMTNLIEGDTARMTTCYGFRVFQDGGLIGVSQVGTEFLLNCLFNEDLDPYNL